MPSGEANLGVVKRTLREERARRTLLLSKAGRLLAVEILESVLQKQPEQYQPRATASGGLCRFALSEQPNTRYEQHREKCDAT